MSVGGVTKMILPSLTFLEAFPPPVREIRSIIKVEGAPLPGIMYFSSLFTSSSEIVEGGAGWRGGIVPGAGPRMSTSPSTSYSVSSFIGAAVEGGAVVRRV